MTPDPQPIIRSFHESLMSLAHLSYAAGDTAAQLEYNAAAARLVGESSSQETNQPFLAWEEIHSQYVVTRFDDGSHLAIGRLGRSDRHEMVVEFLEEFDPIVLRERLRQTEKTVVALQAKLDAIANILEPI